MSGVIEILLVEDDEGDVELTREALEDSKLFVNMNVVKDGIEAMKYLRKEKPYEGTPLSDIILLDLNMPRKNGREVLAEIKSDVNLKEIPVIILTNSQVDEDIVKSYHLGANCYISKPVDLEQFMKVVRSIEEFWFTIVKLPSRYKNKDC